MFFAYRHGAHAAHGPFQTEAEARTYAEKQAVLYPGQAVWLFVPTANVMVAPAEPIWDEGALRPLAPGNLALPDEGISGVC